MIDTVIVVVFAIQCSSTKLIVYFVIKLL